MVRALSENIMELHTGLVFGCTLHAHASDKLPNNRVRPADSDVHCVSHLYPHMCCYAASYDNSGWVHINDFQCARSHTHTLIRTRTRAGTHFVDYDPYFEHKLRINSLNPFTIDTLFKYKQRCICVAFCWWRKVLSVFSIFSVAIAYKRPHAVL